MKTTKDYHNLYWKWDVLLLAEVFEKFKTRSLKIYGLCPSHYLKATALNSDSMIQKSWAWTYFRFWHVTHFLKATERPNSYLLLQVLHNKLFHTQQALAFCPQKDFYYIGNDTDFLLQGKLWYLSPVFFSPLVFSIFKKIFVFFRAFFRKFSFFFFL